MTGTLFGVVLVLTGATAPGAEPQEWQQGIHYTVEARRDIGYDTNLPAEAVIMHHVDGRAFVVDPDDDGDPDDAAARWLPGETFETTAFTTPPPLSEATVAIVTTASLHHPDQDDFGPIDTSYRVLDGSRRDYVIGHWSPNFDRSGFQLDLNVVYPIDRLEEHLRPKLAK